MVAFPDTLNGNTEARMERDALRKTCAVRKAVKMFVGSALVIAAGGLWLVPYGTEDAGLKLIKLLFSVSMLIFGMMFISALNKGEMEPEIRVDAKNRRLTIVHSDESGHRERVQTIDLDDLAEFSLSDGALMARDASGQQVIAVSVSSKATEAALREALRI